MRPAIMMKHYWVAGVFRLERAARISEGQSLMYINVMGFSPKGAGHPSPGRSPGLRHSIHQSPKGAAYSIPGQRPGKMVCNLHQPLSRGDAPGWNNPPFQGFDSSSTLTQGFALGLDDPPLWGCFRLGLVRMELRPSLKRAALSGLFINRARACNPRHGIC